MQYKKVMKLAAICMAMLGLACTLGSIVREERESDYLDSAVNTREVNSEIEEPAEQKIPKRLVPVLCLEIKEETQECKEPVVKLNAADEEILMKLAMSEAEGESTEGKALVILSVLNRIDSDEFPDTVSEVVFQDTQYSPVLDGRYYSSIPDDDCMAALKLVESGWDESQGAKYFENYGADSWHSSNLEFLFQEGNHRFYK